MSPLRFILSAAVFFSLLPLGAAHAADLESFLFNDSNGTQLTAAANTANAGNQWFYAEEATTPGDETTGDVSAVQSGAYQVITDSTFATGLDSRYLDIANVASGTVYLEVEIADWRFGTYDNTNVEQIRFGFLDNDTGIDGATVTTQMQLRRNADTGNMELLGDAIGTSGSFDIANRAVVANNQTAPFTMVMALDKTSNSFEVFYQDGTNPVQVLGLGGVSRARDGNSLRWVTNNFGADNFLPFVIDEEVNIDRIALRDDNPFAGELISLEVDRDSGAITLINTSGASVSGVTGITIESLTGSIDGTQLGSFSGTLGVNQTVALDTPPGSDGPWIKSPIEDLRAELAISGGGVRTIDVNFVENSGAKWTIGDLDFDGVLDVDDYAILTGNAESDLSAFSTAQAYQLGDLDGSGTNDVNDFGIFKDAYIDAFGLTAFALLVAEVPEPSTGLLAFLGLSALGFRRRRSAVDASTTTSYEPPKSSPKTYLMKSSCIVTAFLASLLTLTTPDFAEAVIFEEFLFNDTAGTPFTSLVNNANPGNGFDEDADSLDVVTNGLGQLDASLKSNTAFGTNYIDIEPAYTTGIIYGVMELTWDFQSALDTAENEEIRLSFTNNNPRGSQITAEYRITRNDDNELILNGVANGTGASGFDGLTLNGGSLTQTDKFIAVLAADLDNDAFEVLFSNNDGVSYQSAGVGVMDASRVIESVRLALNNDFSNDNVLIDRLYVTDELPEVGAIDTLTLSVNTGSGAASILNNSDTTFDIDYYRITSGDGSLIEGSWSSLQSHAYDAIDGPDAGTTVGDGVGETWTEAGGSDADVLSESFLLSSSVISPTTLPIGLGAIIDLGGDAELLEFEFRDATTGSVFTGNIEFVDGIAGDFNSDGTVDTADYTVWRAGLGTIYTEADYLVWRANYGTTSGAASSEAAAVPEPATLLMLLLATASMTAARRRVA